MTTKSAMQHAWTPLSLQKQHEARAFRCCRPSLVQDLSLQQLPVCRTFRSYSDRKVSLRMKPSELGIKGPRTHLAARKKHVGHFKL